MTRVASSTCIASTVRARWIGSIHTTCDDCYVTTHPGSLLFAAVVPAAVAVPFVLPPFNARGTLQLNSDGAALGGATGVIGIGRGTAAVDAVDGRMDGGGRACDAVDGRMDGGNACDGRVTTDIRGGGLFCPGAGNGGGALESRGLGSAVSCGGVQFCTGSCNSSTTDLRITGCCGMISMGSASWLDEP